jgi:subtilisin family serine protease
MMQRQSSQENTTTKSDAVRIAILDTGVDGSHPGIYPHWKQVRNIRSWVGNKVQTVYGDGDMSEKQIRKVRQDESGHGTHTTGLVLKVAPNADIFIARIANSDKKLTEENENSIAEVTKSISAISSK